MKADTLNLDALRPEPDGTAPLYQQVARKLALAIDGGTVRPGDALPPERRMCEALGISRVTWRKALETLIEEGLVESRHGSGTYVAEHRVRQPMSILTSFSDDMRARGRQPSSRRLGQGVFPASPEEAMALGLRPGQSVYRLRRLRLADGEPMSIEMTALPADDIPDPEAIGASLYDYLDRLGRLPVRALEYLRAEVISGDDARLLDLADGAPTLFIRRIGYLADNRPIEFTCSYFRGDRYDFVAELNRPTRAASA